MLRPYNRCLWAGFMYGRVWLPGATLPTFRLTLPAGGGGDVSPGSDGDIIVVSTVDVDTLFSGRKERLFCCSSSRSRARFCSWISLASGWRGWAGPVWLASLWSVCEFGAGCVRLRWMMPFSSRSPRDVMVGVIPANYNAHFITTNHYHYHY